MENNQLLLETRRAKGVLIAAHRGAVAGNVPFNTLEAFDAALLQGAHIIETDITKSRDGELFLFHPGQEHNHLNRDIHLETMTGEEIRRERYVNPDNAVTPYGLSTLDEALEHLKGRCLINLDHTWEYLPEVMQTVRRHGMRDAIILKTPGTLPLLKLVEEVAPDYMYMPIIHEADDISVVIEGMDIRYAGRSWFSPARTRPSPGTRILRITTKKAGCSGETRLSTITGFSWRRGIPTTRR